MKARGPLALILFVCFILLATNYGKLENLDSWTSELLLGNSFLQLFHYFGEESYVIPVGILLTIFVAWKKKNTYAAATVFVTIAGAYLVNLQVKDMFKRPRPIDANQLDSYSMPSGHTMASLAFLSMIAFVICLFIKKRSLQIIIWLITTGTAVLCGFSRIAANRHFVTDILAGWSLAGAWILVMFIIYESLKNKEQK